MRGVLASSSFCALLLAHACAHAADLPAQAERVLTGHGIPSDAVSILVQAVGSAEPVLSHFPDVPRNPASVMKLVTTWTALEVLGPAYRWPTEVYFDGEFDGAKLDGDLVLKGYGDPYLVLEEYWKLLRALRRTGLEEIAGGLVVDDGYFAVLEQDPGAFDDQPSRTYNVLPNALLVNFKAVDFRFLADPGAGRVHVTVDPPLSNLGISNRIGVANGACGGYQAGISANVIGAELAEVSFGGAFPARCRSYSMTRTVLSHDAYAFGLFESLWREMGGRIDGGFRRGTAPEDAQPVLVWQSPPLADVIRSINKNSNNVMTRQLLYTLGAERLGPPGTRLKGVEAVEAYLHAGGFDTASLVVDNGAGLSRDARISARLLVDVLHAARRSPYAPEFQSSLSLGGIDGTTRSRFNGHAAAMHVKTGRIDHVSALAGYVRSAAGGDFVVAILVNSPEAHRGPGRELEEAVVKWVHEAF